MTEQDNPTTADATVAGSGSAERKRAAVLAITLALGAAAMAFGTVLWLTMFETEQTTSEELALLLVGGVLTFLFGMGSVVATFSALGLTEPGQPMSLPSGTIQAFIALFLILLFFIMSTFLFLSVSGTTSTSSTVIRDLTSEDVSALEQTATVSVIGETQVQLPPEEEGAEPQTEARFDVVVVTEVTSEADEVAEEIARQLVTTIGTLIVAIASFYFGAKSSGPGDRESAGATSST